MICEIFFLKTEGTKRRDCQKVFDFCIQNHRTLTETLNDVWKSIMERGLLPASLGHMESILNASSLKW